MIIKKSLEWCFNWPNCTAPKNLTFGLLLNLSSIQSFGRDLALSDFLRSYWRTTKRSSTNNFFFFKFFMLEKKKDPNFPVLMPTGQKLPDDKHLAKGYTTPARWLKAKRLEYAKKLLLETDLNISQICYDSGFINSSHFIKAFKEKYKLPPHQYRRQNY